MAFVGVRRGYGICRSKEGLWYLWGLAGVMVFVESESRWSV